MTEFYKSFLAAQKKIDSAAKDSANPHYKSRYESLESVIDAIKKPLNENGIVITHFMSGSGLTTRLIHAESGEYIESTSPLLMQKQDMQQLGSASTYARRQNLKSLTNLPTEDDDGNDAVNTPNSNKNAPLANQNQKNVSTPATTKKPNLDDFKDLAEFRITIGNTLKGKALKDCNPDDIKKMVIWFINNKGSKMSEEQRINVEASQAWLSQFSEPSFDSSENIPF